MSTRPHTSFAVVIAHFAAAGSAGLPSSKRPFDALRVQHVRRALTHHPVRLHQHDTRRPRAPSASPRRARRPTHRQRLLRPARQSVPYLNQVRIGSFHCAPTLRPDEHPVNGVYSPHAAHRPLMPPMPLHASVALPHQHAKRTSNVTTSTAGLAISFSFPTEFHVDHGRSARDRYLTHDNDPDNADYRRFLSRLWDELRSTADAMAHEASTTAQAPAPRSRR